MSAYRFLCRSQFSRQQKLRVPRVIISRCLSAQPNQAANGGTKLYSSADEAVADLKPSSVLLSAGFGVCGAPNTLIEALVRRPGIKNLTAVSDNAGVDGYGLGNLLRSGQISKMITSYLGSNKHFEHLYLTGQISLELCPQGTLIERCRAGAAGIPAFYTPTGYGTVVETGDIPVRYSAKDPANVEAYGEKRESREFDGRHFLLERAIKADYAFVRVWKADRLGNCVFRYSAHNFNGVMARNARMTIVEAEEVVEPGEIDPGAVQLPGIYVDRIVPATAEKHIEKLVLRSPAVGSSPTGNADTVDESKIATQKRREMIVRRAARELRDGMYVNLGVGMPMLAPGFLEPGTKIHFQSENGIIGMGPHPTLEQVDADIVNAGKETVTLLPGASTFDSSESFAMIRGGYMDISILGAMQVSSTGDLANFMVPGKNVKGMGGAMDLVADPDNTKIVVVMDHCNKDGDSKLLDTCNLPLTGTRCVSQVITDLGVFDIDRASGKMCLSELQPGVTLQEVKQKTAATFEVSSSLKQIQE